MSTIDICVEFFERSRKKGVPLKFQAAKVRAGSGVIKRNFWSIPNPCSQ
jgi:hypothetical protein